jgi:hypothetical protein
MSEKPGVSTSYGGDSLQKPGVLPEREYVDKRVLIHV